MITEEIETQTEDENPDDDSSYSGKYCNSNDVLALFGDVSDNPNDDLLTVSIDNTEAWIESNLKRHYVPIPTKIPQTLKTVAIYYASSDILMSLYHGDEYESLMDYWFNKAQDLLDAYIEEYLRSEATMDELDKVNMVKHSHGRTYNQKRGRRGVRGWGR